MRPLSPYTQASPATLFGKTWTQFLPGFRRAVNESDRVDIAIAQPVDPEIDEFYLTLAKPFEDLLTWITEGLDKELYRRRPKEYYDDMSERLQASFMMAGDCEEYRPSAAFQHAKRKEDLKELNAQCQAAIDEIFQAAKAPPVDETDREINEFLLKETMNEKLALLTTASKRLIGPQQTLFKLLL